MERTEFRDLASPEAAREAIASLDLGRGVESIALSEARGRVLAERIDATINVPGFDRATLDGYALRARDTFGADEADPVTLEIVGSIHAGAAPAETVESGTAVEISTGAVMPPGADAMVPVERTERVSDDGDEKLDDERGRGDCVLVRTAVTPGDNVMFAGADVAAGDRALGPGTVITPREIGLLSALGIETVPVRTRPHVGIVSTGDELVRPGEDLRNDRGEIYDVNTHAIAAAVQSAGGEAIVYPHAGDDVDEMARLLRRAADECDLVLSSGSTSAATVDVIYRVVEDRGEVLLHGVAVKPGKPMLIGRIDRSEGGDDDVTAAVENNDGPATPDDESISPSGSSAYVGLPGYPVSAMVVFRTFVAPAIRAAAGRPPAEETTVRARLLERSRFDEGRLRLLPIGLVEDGDGSTLAYPVDGGSGATTSLVDADGVVEVPAETAYLDRGESVDVRLFSRADRPPTLFGVGAGDPVVCRALDALDRPRYRAIGSRPGIRRLRNGVPDVAVVSGPLAADRNTEGKTIGRWDRRWGLIVPPNNPDEISGLPDLIDQDVRFVNRTADSGLRASLDTALESVADALDSDPTAVRSSIEGYDAGRRGYESPARLVARGRADVGLGLAETAANRGLGFVELGSQPVRALANPDRLEKAGVERFQSALESVREY